MHTVVADLPKTGWFEKKYLVVKQFKAELKIVTKHFLNNKNFNVK